MGKKHSKNSSKKGKSKKGRVKNSQSNLSKQENLQKSSFEDITEIFLGGNSEENINNNINSTENIAEASKTKTSENTTETTNTNTSASTNTNECSEAIKAKQQEILGNLKNLSDAIALITLTRDNVDSLRIELLSSIYFTRQIRPLIDAVNLIAFASSNLSNVANNMNINSFGDKKEIKNAFRLCYKMNDEIDDMLNTLSRRIKLYVNQLDNMDKNCPPFSFDEDS